MKLPSVIVMDACTALKPLLSEEGAEKVIKIFEKKNSFELSVLVPDLFRYEFFAVATRKVAGVDIEKCYEHISEKQWSCLPSENDLRALTIKIQKKHPHAGFYDASYHALAKAYKTIFVTADEKYYRSVKGEKDVVLLRDLVI